MCAFNREDHRIDGKLHCWLCKSSYKRALAKAKKSDSEKQRQKKRSADDAALKNAAHKGNSSSLHNRGSNSNSQRPDHKSNSDVPEKIQKTANVMIPSNSDHVVAITQLREQIATLQKKLQQKDNQLLQKDKEVSLTMLSQSDMLKYSTRKFPTIPKPLVTVVIKFLSLTQNTFVDDERTTSEKLIIIIHPFSHFTSPLHRLRNGRGNISQSKTNFGIE